MDAPTPLASGTVFLLNSIGELASVYSLADVAFVGGSLVAAGGHNPLEPAQFRVPIVMGPHYENFRAIVEQLQRQDAIRIVQPDAIKNEFATLLADEASARAMGTRAYTVFSSEAGATARTVDGLVTILGERL